MLHARTSIVHASGTSLVYLVCLVSLMQPNKRDKPNKPNNGLLVLATFSAFFREDVPRDVLEHGDRSGMDG